MPSIHTAQPKGITHAQLQTPACLLDTLTQFCKASADQHRLQILRILNQESFGVLELCRIIDTTQPALSHHLKILAQAGILETRRQGTSIFYRRALVSTEDPLRDLRLSLFQSVDHVVLEDSVQQRISAVYADRHLKAKSFFEKHAANLRKNQNLIAEYAHYGTSIEDILRNEPLTREARVIEIGPGESDLIVHLANTFEEVVALDNTREMLSRTEERLSQLKDIKFNRISFFCGELNDLPEGKTADLIVLNMVLHHMAAPARFFAQASEYLNHDGRLLIAELCSHDQDWTREACGDLWQGFDSAELDEWAGAAGFVSGQSAYIGLKNGFQVQIRIFEKYQTDTATEHFY